MKALVNKAVFFGVSLVLLVVLFGEGTEGAQKRKARPVAPQERKAPAAKPETRILSSRSEVNPEFVQSLADPKLNPEFARQHPDPAQRLQAAQKVADDLCLNFNVTASFGSDAQGCYIDVTYVHNYTITSSTVAAWLPHGIYIEMCPGVQIISPPAPVGAWFSGSIPGSNPSTSNPPWNAVWWVKPVNGFNNIIPSGQTLTVRLRVPGFCAGNPCTVLVQELSGYPPLPGSNAPNGASCQQLLTIGVDSHGYSIGPDISVCTGDFTKVCLNPAPPSTAQITWYKDVGTPCPTATCSILPLGSPWIQDTTVGGVCDPTNILTQTTCYVAMVKDGCGYEITNVKKVDVCPGQPGGTIVATPATGFPAPTTINGDLHACTSWQGQLCLNLPPPSCPTTIVGWTKNGQSITTTDPTKTCLNDTGLLTPGHACSNSYVFQATVHNACGDSVLKWKIFIDRQPDPGGIGPTPPPTLCYDRSTVLTHKTRCGKVVEWEKREETTPCSGTYGPWTVLPGSQGTSVWWTNDLQKTTQYQVKVENGACPGTGPPVYSPVYTVTVKPKLTVSITANKTVLCPGPAILTAHHSWGPPCPYSVTYQWFKDGVFTGQTGPTYPATSGGNYYVIVNGRPCGKAKSNVITICDVPKLVITGDCCVCPGETITLTADLVWKQKGCQGTSCTYQWNPGGATTPTIQVSQPGTYTVTVNCGGCQLSASYTVGMCASPVGVCDREIRKTITPNPVQSGQQVTVTLTVTNVGTAPCPVVGGIVVSDGQPSGLTFQLPVSANKPGWSCGFTPPGVIAFCTSTSPLLPGAANAVTITFAAKVTASAGSTIQNCADVTQGSGDANHANDESCVTVNVQ